MLLLAFCICASSQYLEYKRESSGKMRFFEPQGWGKKKDLGLFIKVATTRTKKVGYNHWKSVDGSMCVSTCEGCHDLFPSFMSMSYCE